VSGEQKDFHFYVAGIEDGFIEVLQAAVGGPDGYLNEPATAYGGELDEKTLKQFIDELTPRFPLLLVSYGEGDDTLMPATSPAFGNPRTWRHDCTFGVICCDDNARSERDQQRGDASVGRPGVIKMISDVRDALGGLRLKQESELLTFEPLRVAGVRYLARLPGLTAYIADFDTYFEWTEPDRRQAGTAVTGIDFEVTANMQRGPVSQLPGVISK
jgi:hypothetical protein